MEQKTKVEQQTPRFVRYMEEYGRHFSYVRPIVEGRVYEVVAARQDSEKTMEFVHTVISLDDYSDHELVDILLCSCRSGLRSFLEQSGRYVVTKRDGTIDRKKSPAWNAQAAILTSHIMETIAGRSVSRDRAYELIKQITHDDPAARWKPDGTFKNNRTSA